MKLSKACLAAAVVFLAAPGALPSFGQSPQNINIGLALSGGGFRSAGFHLGVLRELERQGLLDEVDVISCVSGGCIAAGILVHRWNEPDRLKAIEDYLTIDKNHASRSFWQGTLRRGTSRIDQLAKSYDHYLFKGDTLDDLKSAPRIYFNATNVANGTRFFFASGKAHSIAGSWDDVVVRDQIIDACPARDVPIASAVAASSAFPPVFNPLRLENDCLKSQGVDYVSLTDGGIYDNLGFGPYIYAINRWSTQLDFVIVSDGGKPFAIQEKAATSGSGVVTRMHSIQMANIRSLGLQLLIDRHCSGKGPRPIFFSIDSGSGEAVPGDARFASAIRTDLKGLGDREIEVLMRHGAALVRDRLQTYAPELLSSSARQQSVCQTVFAQGDVGGLFPWDR